MSVRELEVVYAAVDRAVRWGLDTVENSHLLCKGKYQCTADLFVLFGFSCFALAELVTYLLVWLNPNQSNRRSAVQ